MMLRYATALLTRCLADFHARACHYADIQLPFRSYFFADIDAVFADARHFAASVVTPPSRCLR